MFSMSQFFVDKAREELYPKINVGFASNDPNFHTGGHPDFMNALIHILIEEGLD